MSDTTPTPTPTAICPTCGTPGRLSAFAAQQIVQRETALRDELDQLRRGAGIDTAAAAAAGTPATPGGRPR